MRAWTALALFFFLTLAENLCHAASVLKSVPKAKTDDKTGDQNQTINNRVKDDAAVSQQFKANPLKKSDNAWKPERTEEDYRKFSGIRYTPLDLAQYILRTGDEEGVALAIEELLGEGLIERDEAILYLESVKKELANLRESQNKQKQQQKKEENQIQPLKTTKFSQATESLPKKLHQTKKETAEKRVPELSSQDVKPMLQKVVTSSQLPAESGERNVHSKSSNQSKEATKSKGHSPMDDAQNKPKDSSNSLYEEYLLENVIYQLAKDMFSQSMMRDDASAEQLLSRFASFLENELADKKFSKESQEKIIDTVSAALIESLRERLYLEN